MTTVHDVLAQIPAITPWQEDLYVRFHRHPELSMQESRTLAEITAHLADLGYTTHEIGGGVVGVLTNGEGPTVLFRADIDGLPVEESTGLDYASTDTQVDRDGVDRPVMHACGHDTHITAALGTARLLAANRDAWSGTYLALFQPGEETAEGARSMVDAGLTSRVPRPDVALAQHVLAIPHADKVGVRSGPFMSTAASLAITVHGRGSHGSMPHLGVDPVLLAASIVTRLQGIVSRETDPGEFAVVTVGSLQAGTKANVIPDRATLLVNVRAYSEEVREQLVAAIGRIVRAECEASGAPREPEIVVSDEYPLTDNDDAVCARVTGAFREALGPDAVIDLPRLPASEDFSVVPDAFGGVPYFYWGFGGYLPDSTVYPNHSPGFAPVMQPTLSTGTSAAVVAILSCFAAG